MWNGSTTGGITSCFVVSIDSASSTRTISARSALAAVPPRDHLHDLLAVEAAVLDENGAGVDSGERSAGHEQPRHIGFERLAVVERPLAIRKLDARVDHQLAVGTIAGQEEY